MFIAMNNFKVNPEKAEEFERIWRERDTYLNEVPGVVRFALLRGDTPGEYISHSTWESRDAFLAWTQSPAFAAGHRGGSLMGIIEGPPRVALYEAVIDTEFAKATA
jgi:heme-degrading monooxygenase HmoA